MNRTIGIFCLAMTACFAMTDRVVLKAAEFQFRHEHVLGTSLELQVDAPSREVARRLEEAVLHEIDRLAAIVSRYDSESELMRWQRERRDTSVHLSVELTDVLKCAEHWRKSTDGAFDVRIARLAELWKQGETTGEIPTGEELSATTRRFKTAPYEISTKGVVLQNDALPIDLDGLAKGYILDQVCELIESDFPEVRGVTVNIGGDIRTLGDREVRIRLTSPDNPAENAPSWDSIVVRGSKGVATSGNYRRQYQIGDQRYSHILDPRTGMPADHVRSATVIAPKAIDADALATAVSVMSVEAGQTLIQSLADTECLWLLSDGRAIATSGWPSPRPMEETVFVGTQQDTTQNTGLLVDFKLARPSGSRYRRPYVAVWLEDAEGFPVKTAILWMQTEQPGPRWHRDLTRWFRNDRLRKVVENVDLIETVAGATRGPGQYQARFDGTDNTGKPLPTGEYVLCLEVTREHGSYQIIRQKISWGDKPIPQTPLKGNVEIESANFTYTPVPSADTSN
ncbi:MAG: DUF2271 domain-containing protein [Pirellulaceae bacterium]